MQVPYVVSGDMPTLVTKWAREKGFAVPPPLYFEDLRLAFSAHMRQMFSRFEFLREDELAPALQERCQGYSLPIVTLEGVYLHTPYRLELARTTTADGHSRGLASRTETPAHQQAQKLAQQGLREVVLTDDVIFTGSQVLHAIKLLNQYGIRVVAVCAAIGIEEGVAHITEAGMDPVRPSVFQSHRSGVRTRLLPRNPWQWTQLGGKSKYSCSLRYPLE